MAPVLFVPPLHSSVHTFASCGLTDKSDAAPELHCYFTALPFTFSKRVTDFSRTFVIFQLTHILSPSVKSILTSHFHTVLGAHRACNHQVYHLISLHLLVRSVWLPHLCLCCSLLLILLFVDYKNIFGIHKLYNHFLKWWCWCEWV